MEVSVFLPKIRYFKYIHTVIKIGISNCAWKLAYLKSSYNDNNCSTDLPHMQITECDEEPVRYTKALCESRNARYYRLSPELDLPIQLDESNDEKLVDMLIKTKWYVQANIEWFHRITEHTVL